MSFWLGPCKRIFPIFLIDFDVQLDCKWTDIWIHKTSLTILFHPYLYSTYKMKQNNKKQPKNSKQNNKLPGFLKHISHYKGVIVARCLEFALAIYLFLSNISIPIYVSIYICIYIYIYIYIYNNHFSSFKKKAQMNKMTLPNTFGYLAM